MVHGSIVLLVGLQVPRWVWVEVGRAQLFDAHLEGQGSAVLFGLDALTCTEQHVERKSSVTWYTGGTALQYMLGAAVLFILRTFKQLIVLDFGPRRKLSTKLQNPSNLSEPKLDTIKHETSPHCQDQMSSPGAR